MSFIIVCDVISVIAKPVVSFMVMLLQQDLVKQLLKPDVGTRLGNLRGGADDIMRHPWFSLDMSALLHKRIAAPWVPKLRSQLDTSHFDANDQKSRRLGPVVDCSSWDHEF